jgi:hypothetical protein
MCADDPLSSLERELKRYVAFRHRRGQTEYQLSDALKDHRRQVLENLRDDGDESWLVRNGLLEQLADRNSVSLVNELEVGPVLEERRRRAAQRKAFANERAAREFEQLATEVGE